MLNLMLTLVLTHQLPLLTVHALPVSLTSEA